MSSAVVKRLTACRRTAGGQAHRRVSNVTAYMRPGVSAGEHSVPRVSPALTDWSMGSLLRVAMLRDESSDADNKRLGSTDAAFPSTDTNTLNANINRPVSRGRSPVLRLVH